MLQAGQDDLQALQGRLEAARVPHRAIIENDPPYAGELMAIGLQPAPRSEVKRHVKSLPLLR